MGKTSANLKIDRHADMGPNQMENKSNSMSIAQVYVFKHEDCLGWDCFYKDTITVGSSPSADVRLTEAGVDDVCAHIKILNGTISVTSKGSQPVLINGRTVDSCILGPFDFITAGSYSIKVKLPRVTQKNSHEGDLAGTAGQDETEDVLDSATPVPVAADADSVLDTEKKISTDSGPGTSPAAEAPYVPNFVLVPHEIPSEEETRPVVEPAAVVPTPFYPPMVVPMTDHDASSKAPLAALSAPEAADDSPEEKHFQEPVIGPSDDIPMSVETKSPVSDVEKTNVAEPSENAAEEEPRKDYRLVFSGVCLPDYHKKDVKAALAELMNLSPKKEERLFSGRRVIIKKHIDHDTAVKYQGILAAIGATCGIEEMAGVSHPPETDPVIAPVEPVQTIRAETETVLKSRAAAPAEKSVPATDAETVPAASEPEKETGAMPVEMDTTDVSGTAANEDDPLLGSAAAATVYWEDALPDEDYDEDPEPFLREMLQSELPDAAASEGDDTVEIIKTKDRVMVDVRFLNPSEKYYTFTRQGRFCLAEYKNGRNGWVYFDDNLTGTVEKVSDPFVDIATLRRPEMAHKPAKGIYRLDLADGDSAHLSDGEHEYLIRMVKRTVTPEIAVPEKEKNPFYKNLLRSSGFHLLVLFIFGLAGMFPEMPEPKAPDSHFVKIDMSQLQKKTPPVVKPKPKEKPPEVRPSETKIAKADKPKKRAPKPRRKARGVSSSPNAGGGSGKDGNVLNRNINETGILGMIGDSIGFTPKEALATVTNLDVVASPTAGGKNMKVGGIVGKLATDDISIPTGGVVRSSGTKQVLRSVGVAGKGNVAALKKGKTGQNNVMAMVSVDLDKSVRVQGGMSREDVKKVIDAHLDEISFCYENALMDSPALMGNIVFEWKILLSGRVGEVRIKSSSIRSKEIHSCIKAAIKTWQFPEPTNAEVVVSYPFVFNIVGF